VQRVLDEIIKAEAIGLKFHEDWGSTPAAINTCLTVADMYDVQVTIHTNTLKEAGCVEDSINAFHERTIHTYRRWWPCSRYYQILWIDEDSSILN